MRGETCLSCVGYRNYGSASLFTTIASHQVVGSRSEANPTCVESRYKSEATPLKKHEQTLGYLLATSHLRTKRKVPGKIFLMCPRYAAESVTECHSKLRGCNYLTFLFVINFLKIACYI